MKTLIALAWTTVLAAAPVAAQTPFSLGSVTAAPGTLASGTLRVAPRGGDGGTEIPFSILHGRTPGPVLALIAGTHGMEYVPIVALQRLRTTIDPGRLAGTILMVHVANLPSFLGRTIYYSPADGKNLNRVFPGKADGTLSERIADTITREVIARATHVVDIHCGDGNESLRPYVYWITSVRLRSHRHRSRASDGSCTVCLPVEHRDPSRQAGVDGGVRVPGNDRRRLDRTGRTRCGWVAA
jgi:hypothetical protein